MSNEIKSGKGYDIIIKNGRIIDPANNIDRTGDIAISGGSIDAVAVRHEGSNSKDDSISKNDIINSNGRIEIDAEGCIVAPGLMDIHTHLYPFAELGVYPETALFPCGVTTAADAGTSGSGTFLLHRDSPLFGRVSRKFFINVSTAGLSAIRSYNEDIDPKHFNRDGIKYLADKYPEEIMGLKIRFSKELWPASNTDPLKAARELAAEIGTKLMVHCTNPPVEMAEIVSILGKGDILTHAFHGKGSAIIGKDGRIKPEVLAARRKGVVFDVGDAGWHMAFSTVRAAFAEGFYPDTISTDLTVNGIFNRAKSFSLPYVMSKFLALGMNLPDVIRCCTQVPATVLELAGKAGCLTPGAPADIAILRHADRDFVFTDGDGGTLSGSSIIRNMLTVKDGIIVYRDIEI